MIENSLLREGYVEGECPICKGHNLSPALKDESLEWKDGKEVVFSLVCGDCGAEIYAHYRISFVRYNAWGRKERVVED